ncbi:MAG: DoxX family protein [Flavobacteriaceae bacterium]|nr:DoxX family protein [Flavobacteriaceae bacterium]
MKYLKHVLMAVVSITVLNVWLLRFNKPTIYRGGQAKTMIEEFAAYGLSETFVYVIGGLKVLAALGLVVGFFYKKLIVPSSLVIAVLMVGAIFMHFKVQDAAIKFLPATLMLLCSLGVLYLVNRRSVES